jgi:glyoxylase I family protein
MGLDVRGMAPLLQVFDMPGSIHFYRDLLGFEVVATSEPGDDCNWALLRTGGVEVMLNTQYEKARRPAGPDAGRTEGHADICLYFSSPDVDGAYRYLREKGVAVKEPVNRDYGMRQVYLRDPDGYEICFQWQVKESS